MEQDPRRLEVVVESVSLQDVLDDDNMFGEQSHPAKRFNTNNHWDGGNPPENYDAVFSAVTTSRWIDAFHRACVPYSAAACAGRLVSPSVHSN